MSKRLKRYKELVNSLPKEEGRIREAHIRLDMYWTCLTDQEKNEVNNWMSLADDLFYDMGIRQRYMYITLGDPIWISPKRAGNRPCIKGHRITVEEFLFHLSKGTSVEGFACDYEVNPDLLKKILYNLAADFGNKNENKK